MHTKQKLEVPKPTSFTESHNFNSFYFFSFFFTIKSVKFTGAMGDENQIPDFFTPRYNDFAWLIDNTNKVSEHLDSESLRSSVFSIPVLKEKVQNIPFMVKHAIHQLVLQVDRQ